MNHLRIDAANPRHRVSPTLYGIFFEDINHAADGGLYPEQVRNRCFEDGLPPPRCTVEGASLVTPTGARVPRGDPAPLPGWEVLPAGTAWRLDHDDRLNPNRLCSLRLDGPARLRNGGFWGCAWQAGAGYRLTVIAKGTAPITARLLGSDGSVLGETTLGAPGADWTTLHAEVVSSTTALGSFELELQGATTLAFVSAFPLNTWRGRANGLRPDLADKLAELKPSFLRFPGGCLVEGIHRESVYRWKDTVGQLEERRTGWNLWGYRSSNGLGYHEFLQFAEDLGAEAMYVFNCGMSCQGRAGQLCSPVETAQLWQDAIDAVDYALAPATSPWGALRAAHGHPQPFPLKYLEIGNENHGPVYAERYRFGFVLLRARYPDLVLISDTKLADAPVEMIDEHFYEHPNFFFRNSTRYDSYDRNGPRIYVGEYAAMSAGRLGDIAAAVGDAALLCGIERNSDVVTMTSYAPLLAHAQNREWTPTLLEFDAQRSNGTVTHRMLSWFAAENHGRVLPVQLTCDNLPTQAPAGGVGLACWCGDGSHMEFRDVIVTFPDGTTYTPDLRTIPQGWQVAAGTWTAVDGVLHAEGPGAQARLLFPAAWGDCTVSYRACRRSRPIGFMIVYDVRDRDNWQEFAFGSWGMPMVVVHACCNGQTAQLGAGVSFAVACDHWYAVRLDNHASGVRCSVDGVDVACNAFAPTPSMAAAALLHDDGGLAIKLVNVATAPQEVALDLAGVDLAGGSATLTVLAASPNAMMNSLDQPDAIGLVRQAVIIDPSVPRVLLPALSVSILSGLRHVGNG
jgi:alpha-L-arabinofuranosidase